MTHVRNPGPNPAHRPGSVPMVGGAAIPCKMTVSPLAIVAVTVSYALTVVALTVMEP